MGGTRNPYGDTEREETTRIESDSVYVRCPSGTKLHSKTIGNMFSSLYAPKEKEGRLLM